MPGYACMVNTALSSENGTAVVRHSLSHVQAGGAQSDTGARWSGAAMRAGLGCGAAMITWQWRSCVAEAASVSGSRWQRGGSMAGHLVLYRHDHMNKDVVSRLGFAVHVQLLYPHGDAAADAVSCTHTCDSGREQCWLACCRGCSCVRVQAWNFPGSGFSCSYTCCTAPPRDQQTMPEPPYSRTNAPL